MPSGELSWPAISTAELQAQLELLLCDHYGRQCRIVELERRPSLYRTSFAIEEIDVRLDDGAALHLIFKDLSWQTLSESVQRAKPDFLYDPQREIETYRTILAPNRLSTALFYGAIVDHQLERYGLFLEKVPGLELYQIGEFPIWQQVARWLATMHTRFAGISEAFAQEAHLLNYNEGFYRIWIDRAQRFLNRSGSAQPKNTRHRIEWLAQRYDCVVESLMALPVTFVHGEFYASNVLVQETVGELRVCPVDWEMAGVGPGLIDLAALTAGNWTPEEKTALAMAYYGELAPSNGWPSEFSDFLNALEYCELHKAVQWLGWSPDWSPPSEHAQDWLNEALRLAEKLGL